MNYFLIQAILIAEIGDGESSFWSQILVLLVLAAMWGLYSLVKTKRDDFNDEQGFSEEAGSYRAKARRRFGLAGKLIVRYKDIIQKQTAKTLKARIDLPSPLPGSLFDPEGDKGKRKEKAATGRSKDLGSGMELLEPGFLLSIVEDTKGNEKNDVTMRKMNFNELLRRGELDQVNSKSLKVYAVNRGNLYGKDIQCEAMRELSERTMHESKENSLQPVS